MEHGDPVRDLKDFGNLVADHDRGEAELAVQLQDDSIASIKTKGLIGERYVRISPGGSDKIIGPNGKIREVEPPVDIEELLSKYIFGKV